MPSLTRSPHSQEARGAFLHALLRALRLPPPVVLVTPSMSSTYAEAYLRCAESIPSCGSLPPCCSALGVEAAAAQRHRADGQTRELPLAHHHLPVCSQFGAGQEDGVTAWLPISPVGLPQWQAVGLPGREQREQASRRCQGWPCVLPTRVAPVQQL